MDDKQKCSTSLVSREMRIKTIKKFHLTLVRMAISTNQMTTNVDKNVDTKEFLLTVW